MTNSAQFDRNTLAVVKPGVDGSLTEISAQLELYLGAPAQNETALQVVRSELHRLLGVLKMVGLDGAAVFCAELEHTLSEIATNPQQVSAMHRDVLRRALFGITHYLNTLANGADNAALRLFPQYQELQQLRGMEMSFELDLFYPNLDVELPQQVLNLPVQSDAIARLKMLRSQYQQGLLKWLRQDDADASVQQMQQALDGALRCAPQDGSRAFWWIGYGLLDCLKLDGLPAEMNVRKLLGRIDQHFRAVVEGNAGDVNPVLNEMLYLIGQSHAASEQAEAIKQVYALDQYLPELSALSPGEVDQMLGIMRDQLRVAEESWELCAQGDQAACEKFIKYAEQIALQSDKLDRDVLQYLTKQIQALSQYASSPEHARPIAMDMAMALLLLGSGIENYRRIGSSYQEQARILSERMHAAVKQQPEDMKQLTELVDLHYNMEQRGDVMGPLASEMLVNLQHVEQGLNAFFNSASKRDELPELLRLLSQIQGGLRISSLQHAEQLLTSIQNNVRRFSQSNDPLRPAERYALADAMSALENYMQHLTHGQAGDVSRLQAALVEMVRLDQAPEPEVIAPAEPAKVFASMKPAAVEPPQVSVPMTISLVEPPPVSVPMAIAPVEPPQVSEPVVIAPVEPLQLIEPAAIVSLESLQVPVPVAIVPVEPVSSPMEISPPQVTAPIEMAPPQVSEPAEISQPQLSAPVEVTAAEAAKVLAEEQRQSDEDQELLDIFLEEAQEVLTTMRANLEICQFHPESHEPLVSIRRGFHTLKGSGRMVGLTDLGEVAWCVERAMNKWLQDNKTATPGLLNVIEVAVQSFVGWVEMLGKRSEVIIKADDLIAAAQLIENGQDSEVRLAASPASAVPAAGTDFEQVSTAPSAPAPTPPENIVAPSEAILSSPALFNIASAEVKQNIAILHQQLDELRTAVPSVVQYDFMRAAHTLAGVSRTMGFAAVVELAYALEGWLQARLEQVFTLSAGQLQMLEQSIVALDGMLQSICDQEIPQMRSDLVNQLLTDKDKLIEAEAALEPVSDEQVSDESFIYEPASEPEQALQPEAFAPVAQQIEATESQVPDEVPVHDDVKERLLTDKEQLSGAAAVPAGAAENVLQQVVLTIAKPVEAYAEADKPRVYDDVDEQLLPVFLEEADDLCPRIGEGLRQWREPPHDEQQVPLLKRLLHTMKGSSRMVGAMRIGEIAHEMEDRVLAAAQLREEAGYWDALESDFDRILALLEELRGGKPVVEVKPAPAGRRATDQPAGVERRADRRALEPGAERAVLGNMLRVRSEVVDRLVNEAGEISVARSRMETEMGVLKESLLELTASVIRLRKQLREVEIQAESQMQARVTLAKDNAEQFDPLEFDRFTRLQELTRFMNESVHDVQTVQHSMLKNLEETAVVMLAQGRLNRELQQGLMNVRMVSFNSITDRLYRIVRQTGKELNKRANLELQGTNVELDRSVLEKMIAPFEHLLRNSIVHGLENDQVRARSGKLPIGEIRLSLRQESNEVVFEFSDDGAGLNFAKLREKAIANGSLQADEEVSDDQLAQLIFTPGLSTATEITEIAGRGIGMDVVRSEITGLGGRIDVSSKRGEGTQFLIHLPLTLAVTQVLMVRSGEAIYAIPSTMVEQVRQVKAAEMDSLHHARQIEWQDNTYILHYLPHLLGDMEIVQENQPRNPVLLLRSGGQRIALRVDELLGNREAMVKNIGPQLARLSGIAGATVLGDGSVVLILNPVQLAQRIGGISKTKKASAKPLNSEPLIMVVDDSLTVRKITSRMLTRAGYQVVTATDGVDALEKLEEFTPDVMLLDIEMPRMDGFALARELRRDPRTQNLPIIMITSRTADKHRDYAMQLGVNTYLGKPYQEDELLQNIADFVAVHKLDA
jgi:chemosensory pili system protein ChpA (sensor histidine kinase/response regulator)